MREFRRAVDLLLMNLELQELFELEDNSRRKGPIIAEHFGYTYRLDRKVD
jgi:hypothetical protein